MGSTKFTENPFEMNFENVNWNVNVGVPNLR